MLLPFLVKWPPRDVIYSDLLLSYLNFYLLISNMWDFLSSFLISFTCLEVFRLCGNSRSCMCTIFMTFLFSYLPRPFFTYVLSTFKGFVLLFTIRCIPFRSSLRFFLFPYFYMWIHIMSILQSSVSVFLFSILVVLLFTEYYMFTWGFSTYRLKSSLSFTSGLPFPYCISFTNFLFL